MTGPSENKLLSILKKSSELSKKEVGMEELILHAMPASVDAGQIKPKMSLLKLIWKEQMKENLNSLKSN